MNKYYVNFWWKRVINQETIFNQSAVLEFDPDEIKTTVDITKMCAEHIQSNFTLKDGGLEIGITSIFKL